MIRLLRLAIACALLLSTTLHLQAQCPTGDVSLHTQADVNAFVASYPSCTAIAGNLYIGEVLASGTATDINDLSGLMIQTISGTMTLDNNPALTSLAGLGSLTVINGRLDITNNDGLTDIPIFNNLFVGLHITISENDGLTAISGLNSISSMRRLSIFNNSSLASISGLSGIDIFLDLNIQDNPLLVDVSGFSYVSLGAMNILDNASLAICNTATICNLLFGGTIPNNIDGNALGCESAIAVTSACLGGLPVELSNFTLAQDGLNHLLSWTTSSERDNLGFSIEHSYDGNQWRAIGFLDGNGSSNVTRNYSFTHEDAGAGLHYYRLQQIDLNGTFTYSEILQNIIRINEKEGNILAYPNPTEGALNLIISNPSSKKGNLTIASVNGNELFYQEFRADDIQESYIMRFDNLAAGLYVVKLQLGQSITWEKIQVLDNK